MSSHDILSQANTLRITHRAESKSFDVCIDRFTFLDEESEDESGDEYEDDSELHIVVNKTIYASHHSTVYLGKAGNVSLVVKTCYDPKFSKDISNEALVYETMLSGLQGSIVPKFYGYFKGKDHKKRRITCIVLEYCGDTLGMPFDELEMTEKVKIMTVLGKLHQHGYHHGDFRERNVVIHNGEYKLIDFHDIYSHECCWRDGMDWRTDELIHRIRVTFPCDVLFQIGSDMQLWKYTDKPMIRVGGDRIYGTEYPPQEVVDKLLSNWYYSYHTNAKVVLPWLIKVKKEMDENNGNLDIKALIATRPILPFNPKKQHYDLNFRSQVAC